MYGIAKGGAQRQQPVLTGIVVNNFNFNFGGAADGAAAMRAEPSKHVWPNRTRVTSGAERMAWLCGAGAGGGDGYDGGVWEGDGGGGCAADWAREGGRNGSGGVQKARALGDEGRAGGGVALCLENNQKHI
jgi:hypothetical protein